VEELSDEDLEKVAGGLGATTNVITGAATGVATATVTAAAVVAAAAI